MELFIDDTQLQQEEKENQERKKYLKLIYFALLLSIFHYVCQLLNSEAI